MSEHEYVARFRPTWRDLILVPSCVVFVVVGVSHFSDRPVVAAGACLLGGAYPIILVWASASRRVAAIARFGPHVRVVDDT